MLNIIKFNTKSPSGRIFNRDSFSVIPECVVITSKPGRKNIVIQDIIGMAKIVLDDTGVWADVKLEDDWNPGEYSGKKIVLEGYGLVDDSRIVRDFHVRNLSLSV